MVHSARGYAVYRCRCLICRQAHAAQARAYRKTRKAEWTRLKEFEQRMLSAMGQDVG